MCFYRKPGAQGLYGPYPFALNVGLMKPQRGFTPVMGKEKMGAGKMKLVLDILKDIMI
jgi:hypothetical protein